MKLKRNWRRMTNRPIIPELLVPTGNKCPLRLRTRTQPTTWLTIRHNSRLYFRVLWALIIRLEHRRRWENVNIDPVLQICSISCLHLQWHPVYWGLMEMNEKHGAKSCITQHVNQLPLRTWPDSSKSIYTLCPRCWNFSVHSSNLRAWLS